MVLSTCGEIFFQNGMSSADLLYIDCMELKVVVAKYKESVDWTGALRFPHVVFNKNRDEDHLFQFNLPNFGRETDTFFRYIINKYDDLPDYVAFLQGNPLDHCPSAVERINGFAFDRPFEPLGSVYDRDGHILNSTLDWAVQCGIEVSQPVRFISGMQCIVSRDTLRRRSRASYESIYDNVSKDLDHNSHTGYYFEYLWPTILGFNEIMEAGKGC
jgi:hypothetical protein